MKKSFSLPILQLGKLNTNTNKSRDIELYIKYSPRDNSFVRHKINFTNNQSILKYCYFISSRSGHHLTRIKYEDFLDKDSHAFVYSINSLDNDSENIIGYVLVDIGIIDKILILDIFMLHNYHKKERAFAQMIEVLDDYVKNNKLTCVTNEELISPRVNQLMKERL